MWLTMAALSLFFLTACLYFRKFVTRLCAPYRINDGNLDRSFISAGVAASCPAGTTAYDPDGRRENPGEGRVYLNLNEVATCNGTVYGWRYCFDPDDDMEQQLIIAMYRPQQNGTYQLVPGSYRQLNEGFFESFTCRNITLQPSEFFTVQENDVVAFCEEVETSRVEIYLAQRGTSLWYWDAGGCSESSISFTGRPSRQRDRVFLLSAFVGEIQYV